MIPNAFVQSVLKIPFTNFENGVKTKFLMNSKTWFTRVFIKLSGVVTIVAIKFHTPIKISFIPSQACFQLPVNTPVKNSTIPLNICFIPSMILLIVEKKRFM